MAKRTPLRRARIHRLHTWKLVPVHLEHPLWNASTVREPVYVRAYSAIDARTVAAKLTASASQIELPGLPASPWLDANLAIAIRAYADPFDDVQSRGVIDVATGQVEPVSPESVHAAGK